MQDDDLLEVTQEYVVRRTVRWTWKPGDAKQWWTGGKWACSKRRAKLFVDLAEAKQVAQAEGGEVHAVYYYGSLWTTGRDWA